TLPVRKVLLENDMTNKRMAIEMVNSENKIILTLYKLIETVGAKKKRAEKVGECGETLV
ncbi:24366_t:CDS:2, partial [Gigaspora margarita]